MISLALAYLRDRPLTTALNVALLAIAVAMLILLLQLGAQASERLERDGRDVDLVVGAKGSPLQLILSSVFHVDQPTGNVPFAALDLLRRDPSVARAVPLALGDNFRGYRIVGTDESFADLYQTRIAQGRGFDAPMEAVLGASVAAQTGARLGQMFIGSHGLTTDEDGDHGHENAPFTTVGILEPTGTVADRLILTPFESVWEVHGIKHDHDHDTDDDHDHDHGDDHEGDEHAHEGHDHAEEEEAASPFVGASGQSPRVLQARSRVLEQELTALLVTYRNASGAVRIPSLINRQTQMQSAVPAVETTRLLELIGASFDGIRLFAWLLTATGGLAIFVALLNMARSREGDLALLRVMGASRVQVVATVVMEGVITAALGAVLGWIAAHTLIALAKSNFATLADLGLTAWNIMPAEGFLLIGVVGIGALAALIPAWRVYKVDPARIMARI
ncbi:MAG: ABC transporter permease [Erythrobacter sp.]|uniref:ABC transporter permease n=1 Tax=Erythrobacter sp. TaxID=1042 RepID=UPI00261069E1|nr:ABC transporter permease [Erythrobacter sp.]MDJ0977735.1 ABC transporter permease [Erythrobacter sp.]